MQECVMRIPCRYGFLPIRLSWYYISWALFLLSYDYLFILLYHLPRSPISDFSPSPSSGGQWSDQPAAYCPARLPVPLLLILTSRGYFSMLCKSSVLSSPCSFGCILSSSTLYPHSLSSSFSNASFILCIYAVCLSRPPLITFSFWCSSHHSSKLSLFAHFFLSRRSLNILPLSLRPTQRILTVV